MNRPRGLALLAATVMACGGPPEGAPAFDSTTAAAVVQMTQPVGSLTGTQWRLVAIMKSADTTAAEHPEDPAAFTVEFRADGRLSMRLDCNSGTGTWSVVPDTNASSGEMTLGPMGMTLAACPSPDLGIRLARDMVSVRRYALRDGRLELILAADGGSIVWEPDPDFATVIAGSPDSAGTR